MIPENANIKVLHMIEQIEKGAKPQRTLGSGDKNIELGGQKIKINTATPTTFGDFRRDELGEVSHQGISSDQYNLMIFADSPTDMQFLPSSMVTPLPERIPWLPPSIFVKGLTTLANLVDLMSKLGMM